MEHSESSSPTTRYEAHPRWLSMDNGDGVDEEGFTPYQPRNLVSVKALYSVRKFQEAALRSGESAVESVYRTILEEENRGASTGKESPVYEVVEIENTGLKGPEELSVMRFKGKAGSSSASRRLGLDPDEPGPQIQMVSKIKYADAQSRRFRDLCSNRLRLTLQILGIIVFGYVAISSYLCDVSTGRQIPDLPKSADAETAYCLTYTVLNPEAQTPSAEKPGLSWTRCSLIHG